MFGRASFSETAGHGGPWNLKRMDGSHMYLARKRIKGKLFFSIRESFRDGQFIRSRELMNLGPTPSRHIIYPGGNAFYIGEAVTDTLSDLGVEPTFDELENIFWPFLKPSIQRRLEPFRHRTTTGTLDAMSEEKKDREAPIHGFDSRRICYLKCGHINERLLAGLPPVLTKHLRKKSRDEIEQDFMVKESCLRPWELKSYGFAIFDLQRFFSESFARNSPQWLDQKKIDEVFLEEICCLQEDPDFWAGEAVGDRLHEYLCRYVIMFFDHDYERPHPMNDYVRDFMNRHRSRRSGPFKSSVDMDMASAVFGVKKETLRTMTKRGLTRYYRRLAKKLHPDKGGSHEKFVELTQAYHALLKKKG